MKDFIMKHPIATVFLAMIGHDVVAGGYNLVDRNLKRKHEARMAEKFGIIAVDKDDEEESTSEEKEEP